MYKHTILLTVRQNLDFFPAIPRSSETKIFPLHADEFKLASPDSFSIYIVQKKLKT